MHRTCRGFTVVEMLVVVAIILLMLSFLLPSLDRAQQTAEMTVCGARMSQIHLATIQYAGDHFMAHPHPQHWVDGVASYPNCWTSKANIENGQLWPYMAGQYDAYLCPTFKAVYKQNPNNIYAIAESSITMNVYFGHGNGTWEGWPTLRRLTEVQSPSRLMLFCDENPWVTPGYSSTGINNLTMGVGKYSDPARLVDSLGSFHLPRGGDFTSGLSDVLCVDGHLEQHGIEDSKEVATPQQYK